MEAVKQELNRMSFAMWFESIKLELWHVSLYALVPAMVITFNSVFGLDVVFPMWLMVVVVSYGIHRKRLPIEKPQTLMSAEAWCRYNSLLLVLLATSFISSDTIDEFPPMYKGLLDLTFRVVNYHMKISQHIALYRFYLSVFGNAACIVKTKFIDKNHARVEKSDKNQAVVDKSKFE